jgi:hypothetical protein
MQFQTWRASILLSLLLFAPISWVRAQTALLAPIADTTLLESNPLNNLGALDNLTAGTSDEGFLSRALLRFDVSSSIPVGASITQVNLFVAVVTFPLGGDSNFGLHRLLRDWGEGDKDESDVGAPATTGEATWLSRFHPATLWTAPGGQAGTDYEGAPSAVVSVSGLDLYEFESSAALIADVQNWLDNPASNFGWMLKTEDEVEDATIRCFASREDLFGDAPQLVVKYTMRPRIRHVEVSGNKFCLQFRAQAGKAYTVERRDAVQAGNWTVITNIPPAATASNLSVCDSLGSGNRFYRVGEQP